jgi:hypothetical protein
LPKYSSTGRYYYVGVYRKMFLENFMQVYILLNVKEKILECLVKVARKKQTFHYVSAGFSRTIVNSFLIVRNIRNDPAIRADIMEKSMLEFHLLFR